MKINGLKIHRFLKPSNYLNHIFNTPTSINSLNQIGKLGEKIAETFLILNGYKILNKNFRTPFGEIDIVTQHANFIVFFEIKTRTSEKFGNAFSSITTTKQKHILNNCLFYLKQHKLSMDYYRIDGIAIKLDSQKNFQILKHLKNIITSSML
ncbi:MAG: YraN family protein [Candidatus Omnitrophota bacterium]|nr:YraN family protein [Candidatus Omnitrophota bacterium]